MLEDAEAAVAEWEDHIAELMSIHTELTNSIDWKSLASKSKPSEPVRSNTRQLKAEKALSEFKPSFFDRLRGGSEKRREKLEASVADATARDGEDYEQARKRYEAAVAEWESDTSLARRLAIGEAAAIREVIEEFQSISDEGLIGSSVSFAIDDNYVHVRPFVHTDEIVPNFRRKLLASGKLSESKMPIGQFNEIYQDYVASVALKVAGDLFQILPIDEVYVTCESSMLDSATGHKSRTPILSVQFVRQTFSSLNLDRIDPSDSLSNFNHRMKFKKAKGFEPIEALPDPQPA